ncbi:amidohydrolase family protein [Amycolatopsis sp. K13G38]|uniref:Amidohydrolase family protein n=1 Tax=Amycolatopsis acididurans TaxID=2724524 RepID=A0ABX1J8P0_9PSEU|nr:amidohydrolase family protein [Amycolatopsis acididurans]NKQ56147.1 amidohydrolase family protein [Amycolatopsis acididurans]
MLNEKFVIDSVVHAYNLDVSNYAVRPTADAISQMVYAVAGVNVPPDYAVAPERWIRDWDIDEVAGLLFRESATDFAVFHPTPIGAYHDGMTSVEKAAAIVRRWPSRFRTYATVDPLGGAAALAEFDRQVELLSPAGLKLYPSSWTRGYHEGWRMGDPEIAFPFFERARHHGVRTIAIHKAIPFGDVPMESYKVDDLDAAAAAFPDLNFEIVHGGVAFVEETAWLLARFPNVWVNLEGLSFILAAKPRTFASLMLGLCSVGGPPVLDRMVWATGAMGAHPRLLLDAFDRFQFPQDLLENSGGLFSSVPQITEETKANILGRNYARMAGLDLGKLAAGAAGDEFDGADVSVPAYSTTKVAVL